MLCAKPVWVQHKAPCLWPGEHGSVDKEELIIAMLGALDNSRLSAQLWKNAVEVKHLHLLATVLCRHRCCCCRRRRAGRPWGRGAKQRCFLLLCWGLAHAVDP